MTQTTRFLGRAIAAMAIFAIIGAYAGAARATTFAAWQVHGVAFGDTLNVRKFPSSGSQKQAAYPNKTILQMTGPCTAGINLLDIGSWPKRDQAQVVRHRWCQVWHDPARNGVFVTGWVYGRYIQPAE